MPLMILSQVEQTVGLLDTLMAAVPWLIILVFIWIAVYRKAP